jgi:hypothetical protein
MNPPLVACVGCGALVPELDGPTHPYIGASPGCWAIHGELSARAYADRRRSPVHQLMVDAYAVQHPGKPERRAIQSVAVHLVGLCAQLERGISSEAARRLLVDALRHRGDFVWLEPPIPPAALTILHLREASDLEGFLSRAHDWAASVWQSRSPHHPAVRRWTDLAMARSPRARAGG